jgi:hypothetical protein
MADKDQRYTLGHATPKELRMLAEGLGQLASEMELYCQWIERIAAALNRKR